MTEIAEPTGPAPSGAPPAVRRRRLALAAGTLAVIAIVALLLAGGGSGPGPAGGAARLVPADALAFVDVSLDSGRPSVRQALSVAARFPDFPLAAATVQGRLAAILGGGHGAGYGAVSAWAGDEAALALLNTPTTTAGSLIAIDVRSHAKAAAFVRARGATAHGSYRGIPLLSYPTGSELAFVSHFLVLGQDASVRAALDVATGHAGSLSAAGVYRRALAGAPADRVLDAYASLAGVRRLLAAQPGVIGAVGSLLYQPALQGVDLSLSPTTQGARVRIHSALDPSLTRLSPPSTQAFSPTLENVMPAGAILMFDVAGLDRIAPSVLNAGSVAGIAGGIGPLLSRLGAALRAEGVNVAQLTALFHPETALAIVPHQGSPTLVIVARTRDEAQARTELAQLEVPLAQLFMPSGSGPGKVPVFNDRTIDGVTAHQLALTNGFELDYAVFRGLIVISTSLDGVAAVAVRSHPLASDPGFAFALGGRPAQVTSLVYLDLQRLLTLGEQTGLAKSARYRLLRADLQKITALGLSSTRTADSSTAELAIRIR